MLSIRITDPVVLYGQIPMASSYTLSEIYETVEGISLYGAAVFTGISTDSRNVKPGTLYVALSGGTHNGHDFVSSAFEQGAVAALVEDAAVLNSMPGIVVRSTRKAWSSLSACWHGKPSKELQVIGVTGTNGKTTVQWLLAQALQQLDQSVVRIGTLGIYHDNTFISEALTTPDAFDIQRALKEGLEAGATSAVLEVSSHGLSQERVSDIVFSVAVFTNLTRDHLDYHENFDAYFEAKQTLFTCTAASGGNGAVLNFDDTLTFSTLQELCEVESLPVITYGFTPGADIHITNITLSLTGATISISRGQNNFKIETPCIGKHNASNLAAVWGALSLLGVTDEAIVTILPEVKAAPGRLESVGNERIGVYVDYAHTPDALENVLQALRPVSNNKLWVVFGCGGDRDRGKRPLMGSIAARLADHVVVTSDNPRTENPDRIIEDILASGITATHVIPDRRAAIHTALAAAETGDVVLVAGKGHEDYQIIGTEKIHFSDQEEVRAFFAAKQVAS